MNVTKCIDVNNETFTIEELSNFASDFGYDASRLIEKLTEKPAFEKVLIKLTLEIRTE